MPKTRYPYPGTEAPKTSLTQMATHRSELPATTRYPDKGLASHATPNISTPLFSIFYVPSEKEDPLCMLRQNIAPEKKNRVASSDQLHMVSSQLRDPGDLYGFLGDSWSRYSGLSKGTLGNFDKSPYRDHHTQSKAKEWRGPSCSSEFSMNLD